LPAGHPKGRDNAFCPELRNKGVYWEKKIEDFKFLSDKFMIENFVKDKV